MALYYRIGLYPIKYSHLPGHTDNIDIEWWLGGCDFAFADYWSIEFLLYKMCELFCRFKYGFFFYAP